MQTLNPILSLTHGCSGGYMECHRKGEKLLKTLTKYCIFTISNGINIRRKRINCLTLAAFFAAIFYKEGFGKKELIFSNLSRTISSYKMHEIPQAVLIAARGTVVSVACFAGVVRVVQNKLDKIFTARASSELRLQSHSQAAIGGACCALAGDERMGNI